MNNATKVILFKTIYVFFKIEVIQIHLDVKHGTMENVLNVHKDGILTEMVFVNKSVIIVEHGQLTDNVKLVIAVISYK